MTGRSFIVYDVTGAAAPGATAGVPDGAPGTAGDRLSITFYDATTSTQLGQTLTAVPGQAVPVRLSLDGVALLGITCEGTSQATGQPTVLEAALGDPRVS